MKDFWGNLGAGLYGAALALALIFGLSGPSEPAELSDVVATVTGGEQQLLAKALTNEVKAIYSSTPGMDFSVKKSIEEIGKGKEEKFYLNLSDVVGVASEATLCAAGMAEAWAAHEFFLGHQAMADVINVHLNWRNDRIMGGSSGSSDFVWLPGTTDQTKLRSLSISGIAGGAVNTELMFKMPRNSFTVCSILWSTVNEISYPIKHFTSQNGYGDFEMFRRNGGNDKIFAAMSMGHGILSLARLVTGFDPGFDIKVSGDTFMVSKVIVRW